MAHSIAILEKPSQIVTFLPALEKCFGEDVVIATTMMLGPYRFSYRRDRKMSDVPIVAEPEFRIDTGYRERARLYYGGKPILLSRDPVAEIGRRIHSADRVICATDCDHTGLLAFYDLLDAVDFDKACDPIDRSYPAIFPPSWYSDDVLKHARLAAEGLSGVTRGTPVLLYGQARRWFTYNFNLNSLVLWGSEPHVTKFMLLALAWLALQEKPVSEGQLARRMQGRWQGPKYRDQNLGSPASILPIIQTLMTGGLVERDEDDRGRGLRLTVKGREFMDRLHPDCIDHDLPGRLDAWCQAGLDASRPAMERYIRTFFGKARRYRVRQVP